MLDLVFVTELKTTLAKVAATNLRRRGFFSWWSARDVQQSHNDGILLLVRDEWQNMYRRLTIGMAIFFGLTLHSLGG